MFLPIPTNPKCATYVRNLCLPTSLLKTLTRGVVSPRITRYNTAPLQIQQKHNSKIVTDCGGREIMSRPTQTRRVRVDDRSTWEESE